MSHCYRVTAAFLFFLAASPEISFAQPVGGSRITAVTVAGTQAMGVANGIEYVRTYGVVHGVVDLDEDVVGLTEQPLNALGMFEYESEFEIIAPAPGEPVNQVVFVDSENRGRPRHMILVNEVTETQSPLKARYADGLGNSFFQRHKTTYARVQWQTGLSAGVPENAQGVGFVILRDFARLLGGYTMVDFPDGFPTPTYEKRILGGKSQSAWFVNAFVTEGFNVEPVTGESVFQGAISVNGAGNWMALNTLAEEAGAAQHPYIVPDAKPLASNEILHRPDTDPVFVDVAAYTDFYRLRAGYAAENISTGKYRRYDIPAPHAMVRPPAGPEEFADCNNGVMTALNPVDMAPYIRAMIVGLEKAIGVESAEDGPTLPPSTFFAMAPAPASHELFNPLPGQVVEVPLTDSYGWPVGGVRFPESYDPLGRPYPVSLPPVVTDSIDNTCGNRGRFQPYSTAELTTMYGSKKNYLDLYRSNIGALVQQGFLLSEDEIPMLDYASYLWDNAENYLAPPDRASAD
jgi:hypothetical protein